MDIILASSSPYRKKLLEDFGLPCQAIKPPVDEDSLKDPLLSPQSLCKMLAHAKAQSLATTEQNSVIIGGDQLINFQGQILGKAGSLEKAADQLLGLSGKSHELITSLCVIYQDQVFSHTDITTMTMRPLSKEQAKLFVKRDKAWDCAGSYKLEKSGTALFKEIKTNDHTAIIGLPLLALTDILIQLGLDYPFFNLSNEKETPL